MTVITAPASGFEPETCGLRSGRDPFERAPAPDEDWTQLFYLQRAGERVMVIPDEVPAGVMAIAFQAEVCVPEKAATGKAQDFLAPPA